VVNRKNERERERERNNKETVPWTLENFIVSDSRGV
jgi:hypothetical protein